MSPAASGKKLPCEPCAYTDNAAKLFQAEDFDELDRIATFERTAKGRWEGGGWKLRSIYEGVGRVGNYDSDRDWTALIAKLKRWQDHNPNSITANVALAAAYTEFAWKGRGRQVAGKVTQRQWEAFHARMRSALEVLSFAAHLPEKCPEYYAVMLSVARGQNWNRDAYDAVLEQGIALEPNYHYLYHERAVDLLPRWDGRSDEELSQFADSIAKRFPGDDGQILYFRVAEGIIIWDDSALSKMSYERLENGYRTLISKFGRTDHLTNVMASIAATFRKYPTSLKYFDQLHDQWDPSVWNTWPIFLANRLFVETNVKLELWVDVSDPVGRRYNNEIESSFAKMDKTALHVCFRSVPQETPVHYLLALLSEKGSVIKSMAIPESNTGNDCAAQLFQNMKFPKPPKSPFWAIVDIGKH